MDVDLIFKIAAVGILVAVLNILLTRSGREDQALMTSITGLVVVLVIVVQEISELFDLIRDLFASTAQRPRVTARDDSASMSRAEDVKPAVAMVSSRSRCISCRMSMCPVRSAAVRDTTVRHWM